ncbi:MAG: hypothetical protein E6H92_04430, partial [Chloroflexi bacterium]
MSRQPFPVAVVSGADQPSTATVPSGHARPPGGAVEISSAGGPDRGDRVDDGKRADKAAVSILLGFTNARVIDGLGGVIPGATVELKDGRISRVDPSGAQSPTADGWIDLAGRTVLPGLVDAHVHLSSYPEALGLPPARRGEPPMPRELRYFALAKAARDLLRAGITT